MEVRDQKADKKKKKTDKKALPVLEELEEDGEDVDMSSEENEDTRESLKMIINKKVTESGSAKYKTREVGAKSARLDTSSSSNGGSPDLSKQRAWQQNQSASARKKNLKKKKF